MESPGINVPGFFMPISEKEGVPIIISANERNRRNRGKRIGKATVFEQGTRNRFCIGYKKGCIFDEMILFHVEQLNKIVERFTKDNKEGNKKIRDFKMILK